MLESVWMIKLGNMHIGNLVSTHIHMLNCITNKCSYKQVSYTRSLHDNVVDKQQLLVKPRSTNCYSAGVHTISHDYNTLVTLPSAIYCYQGHWTGHCIIANLIEHVKLGNLGN